MDRTPEHERAWVLSEGALGSWEDALQLYATSLGQAIELTASAARIEALTEALTDLLSWFAEKPEPAEWRLKAGEYGADDAIKAARAAIAQPSRED